MNEVDSVQEITSDRWDISQFYSQDIHDLNKSMSKWCGILDNVYSFDHRFFNLSPREASNMDPQQRVLLEVAWQCIEDSGIPLHSLQRQTTSVYAGVMTVDHRQEVVSPELETDSYSCLGNYECMLANRISYTLDLRGASVSINAACASSLVAVHEAKRALQLHECNYALAACVNLNLHPWKYISFSKSRMLSPDGRCKTFDKDANGYVPGDGAGVLILQRLEDAVMEGNHIYGIIKGSAYNHGGKSASITAPRMEAQRDVIIAAYQDAGISPDTVTYVEAHGTGTSLGDPVEVEALTQAFRHFTSATQFCRIGSVKTNIGHLESAAGMAGIIKVIMMMQHGKVPGNLHFKEPNPIIEFEQTPFIVASCLTEWTSQKEGIPLRAGVSSFGFGGVNSHILLEQYVNRDGESMRSGSAHNAPLFVLSAKNPQQLRELIASWKKFSFTGQFKSLPFNDICKSLLTGRSSFPYRYAVTAASKEHLSDLLHAQTGVHQTKDEPNWFLRIGHISFKSYEDMARYVHAFPQIKITIDTVFEAAALETDELKALYEAFYRETWEGRFRSLYLFIAGYAINMCLLEAGLSPLCITGEQSGVWTALAVSGIVRPADVCTVLTGRCDVKSISFTRPTIRFYDSLNHVIMQPWLINESYVRSLFGVVYHANHSFFSTEDFHKIITFPLLKDHNGVAYYVKKAQSLINSQHTFKKYIEEWSAETQKITKLNLVELLLNERFIESFAELNTSDKSIVLTAIASSLRKLNRKWDLNEKHVQEQRFCELLDLLEDEVLPKEAFIQLVVNPEADFAGAAKLMNERQYRVRSDKSYKLLRELSHKLVEIKNPQDWIKKLADTTTADRFDPAQPDKLEVGVCNPSSPDAVKLTFREEAETELWNVLRLLWLKGTDFHWDKWFPSGTFQRVSLPTTRFESVPLRLHKAKSNDHRCIHNSMLVYSGDSRPRQTLHPMLGYNQSTLDEHRYQTLFTGTEFFLNDHVVGGNRTLPGVAYMEMAFAAAHFAGIEKISRICDVVWSSPLALEDEPKEVSITLSKASEGIQFYVWTGFGTINKVLHGQGTINGNPYSPVSNHKPTYAAPLDICAAKKRCTDDIKEVYGILEQMNLSYGPSFQVIREYSYGDTEAISRLELPAICRKDALFYNLHPSMLDGALQTAILLNGKLTESADYLPYSAGRVTILDQIPYSGFVYVKQTDKRQGSVHYQIQLLNDLGQPCIEMKDFSVRQVQRKPHNSGDHLKRLLDKLEAGEIEPDEVKTYVEGL
ncbi:hypothetical protein PDUR_11275 [Paenibacillus durus]|uniref:Uncharacterized protein n=2 Tax=Paenibacillus durus TaxID=44251 RepID=A0A089ITZ0_PAEDU|nr:hypothetical protein PDUR_11275 [Paenibacillus durus]